VTYFMGQTNRYNGAPGPNHTRGRRDMAKTDILTPDVLKQLFAYDAETGRLTWLHRDSKWFADGLKAKEHTAKIWNAKWAGSDALRINSYSGYGSGAVLGIPVLAHRVAWSIYHSLPLSAFGEIDHINGCKSDNRICNLRAVGKAGNSRNLKLYSSNKSGVPGVIWEESHKAWAVRINFNGRQKRISRHKLFSEAVAARQRAEVEHNYHPNHGRIAESTGG